MRLALSVKQDVRWLQVAVQNAALVRVTNRFAEGDQQPADAGRLLLDRRLRGLDA
jgi:hypothetical protein